MYNDPLAYFLTFRTYGTWLPGDERGTVTDGHNRYCEPYAPKNERRQAAAERRLKHAPLTFDISTRERVDTTIREACEFRGWTLHALNVRSNHVHAVLSCPESPEKATTALKARVTRRLRETGCVPANRDVWARDGSTRYRFKPAEVERAVEYVLHHQDGE